MKRIKKIQLFTVAAVVALVAPVRVHAQLKDRLQPLTRFVDPFIGSKGHGHVFVGANVPSGAVQLGPSQIMQQWDQFNGWDWCSGYNYISKEILGFSHTHLSGTGIGDMNDILVVPANGKLQLTPAKFNDMESGYGSFFSKTTEVCKPGYYSVDLDKYQVKAELTASERVGFHRYHYGKTENAHLLLDLDFSMLWDKTMDTYITQINDHTIAGYRFSKGWADDQRVYFAMELSVPISRLELYLGKDQVKAKEVKGTGAKAAMFFDAVKHPDIEVKVGISPVSAENALANIRAEIPGWDFEKARQQAGHSWNKELNKIVYEADQASKTTFYTALYHAHFFPSIFNDHNGDYRGTDKKVYRNQKFTNYTTFSLWDSYRGLHPLLTITDPERVKDLVHSMLVINEQQGKLPVWPLQGNETNCMIGYPAIAVITDAYLKGLIPAADVETAYQAVKQTAMRKQDGVQFVQKISYIPADSMKVESVAWGLEYAIADWGISKMAAKLGKKEDAAYFAKRAKLYEQYFEPSKGFFVGRMADGSWRTPFDPVEAKHRQNDYCEGNGWQYAWLVPQDPYGLIRLHGGEKAFTAKLDTFFKMSSNLGQEVSPDISGMVGQYAQGNEPSHHIAYLFSYAGKPWRTAELVREVMTKYYTNDLDGICGNEDAGQMSAWYVLSSMGFYSVNPMSGVYVFGSPLMNKAVISSGNKKFTIVVENQSKANIYIQRIVLNGKPYNRSYIRHSDLVKGGKMVIYMGNQPSKTFGVKQVDRPV